MAEQETLEAIEKTIDTIEEQIDTIERIPKFNLNGTTKKQAYLIIGTTLVTGLVTGGLVSHLLTKKLLVDKMEKRIAEEVEVAKHFYSRFNKVDEHGNPLSPEEMLAVHPIDAAADAQKSYDSPVTVETPAATEEELMAVDGKTFIEDDEGKLRPKVDYAAISNKEVNVFDTAAETEDEAPEEGSGWDTETEVARHERNKPYVITFEEYYQEQLEGYEQDDLTYYENDGVIEDGDGNLFEDVDRYVGLDNLERFGMGSKDRNTVFVRNDEFRMEYEITKTTVSYAKTVMGFDDQGGETKELKHAHTRPRKMRLSDE